MKLLFVFAFLTFTFVRSAAEKKKQPYIFLLVTDQQQGETLGCSGNVEVLMPNSNEPADLLIGLSPWYHIIQGNGSVARKYNYKTRRITQS